MVDWAKNTMCWWPGPAAGVSPAPIPPRAKASTCCWSRRPTSSAAPPPTRAGVGCGFPCNPVLVRAGTDDTIEDALTYYHAVVGDRTPRELQETFVRGGAPLIEYLEQDPNLKFVPLPWPDYYGKAPKARAGRPAPHRGQAAEGGRRARIAGAIRGPLDTDRLGAETPPDYYVGGRALIARFLKAIGQYPNASLRRTPPWSSWWSPTDGSPARSSRHAGERRAIRTRRGVLLAAGGFENNDELRARVRSAGRGARHHGRSGKSRPGAAGRHRRGRRHRPDGSGVVVARHDPSRRPFRVRAVVHRRHLRQPGRQPVRQRVPGLRPGRPRDHRPLQDGSITLPYWMIYDDKEGEVPPVKAANVAIVETEKYVAAGLWHTADTLEELAGKIGVPRRAAGGNGRPVQRVCRRRCRRGLRSWRRGIRSRVLRRRVAAGVHRPAAVSRGRVRHLRSGHQGRPAHRHRGAGARHRPAIRSPACTRRATRWPRPAARPIPVAATRSGPACCSATWRCWTCSRQRRAGGDGPGSLRPPLDAAALRAELSRDRLGWRQLDVVEQTGSTNADLLARAAAGDRHRRSGADRRAPDRRSRAARPRWSAAPRAQITMSVGVSVVDVPADRLGLAVAGHRCGGRRRRAPLLDGPGPKRDSNGPTTCWLDGGKLAGILAEVARRSVM